MTLEAFFQQYPKVQYTRGETIISAHSEFAHFYYVESGAVKMSKTTQNAKKINLHIFFPKAFFSLFSLIEEKNDYDFEAMISTVVRKVPREDLVLFFKNNSVAMFDLQLRLLKGLQGLVLRIEQIALNPALDQVSILLNYFAKHFGEDLKNNKIGIKITHQEIAEWLGLSRENVSIQMKKLEENGVIVVSDHHIKITAQ